MSAPRLILKHPTGWFAAGREFAHAMALVSDGAFKLYVHVCLAANRHTGCLVTSSDELAGAVKQSQERVASLLAELEDRAVCAVDRHNGSNLALEISDRFWPYQKQPSPGCKSGAVAGCPQCCRRRGTNRIVGQAQLRVRGHLALDRFPIIIKVTVRIGQQALDLLPVGRKLLNPPVGGPVL